MFYENFSEIGKNMFECIFTESEFLFKFLLDITRIKGVIQGVTTTMFLR